MPLCIAPSLADAPDTCCAEVVECENFEEQQEWDNFPAHVFHYSIRQHYYNPLLSHSAPVSHESSQRLFLLVQVFLI